MTDPIQVLAEPKRRRILALVWGREMAASDIAGQFDVTFGAVSQHLGVLREADFVKVRRDGNRRLYSANLEVLEPFRPLLEAMWGEALSEIAKAIEQEGES